MSTPKTEGRQAGSESRFLALYWLVLLTVLTVAMYLPSLQIGYYHDNCRSILQPPSSSPWYYWTHSPPRIEYSYRPVHYTILLAIQRAYGLNPVPVHMVVLPLSILVCWLIFVFMRTSGFCTAEAALASLFMLVYEVNSAAVLRLDNLNQPLGVTFGLTALWLANRGFLHTGRGSPPRLAGWPYALSLAALAMALFTRETLLPYSAMLALVVFLNNRKSGDLRSAIGRSILQIAPYVIVTAIYIAVRLTYVLDQPKFGPGEYDMHLGANIIKNAVLYVIALSMPISTVDMFAAVKTHNFALAGVFATFTLVWVAAIMHGILRSRKRPVALALAAFTVIGWFPVILMNHLSEQWGYTVAPFVTALIGIGAVSLVSAYRKLPAKRALAVALIALALVSHGIAMHRKMMWLKHGNDFAISLRGQINKYALQAPLHSTIWIVNRPRGEVEYGHYLVRGTGVLCHTCLDLYCKRPRINYRLVEPDKFRESDAKPGELILRLEGETLKPSRALGGRS
jgi:hypothetical protein